MLQEPGFFLPDPTSYLLGSEAPRPGCGHLGAARVAVRRRPQRPPNSRSARAWEGVTTHTCVVFTVCCCLHAASTCVIPWICEVTTGEATGCSQVTFQNLEPGRLAAQGPPQVSLVVAPGRLR